MSLMAARTGTALNGLGNLHWRERGKPQTLWMPETSNKVQACTLPYPDRFHAAVNFIVNNTPGSTPIPDELRLVLYALHQQATVGPCTEAKPWGWNVVESAKWESWNQLGNMSSVEAMRLYVKMVEDDQPNWWGLSKAHQQTLSALADNGDADAADGAYFASPALEAAPVGVWSAPYVEGPKRPPPRYEHASAVVGSQLFVFGGNCGGRYLGDMWILHLDSLTWQAVTPKPAEAPAENGNSAPAVPPVLSPSAGHAMAAWGPKLLIVGGHVKATAASKQIRVACYDTETDSLSTLQPSGQSPTSRGGHSATVVNGSLFIFGGEDASRRPVSDLYVLDLGSMAWREVATTGRAPAARSAHAAVPYKNRFLIIFGGGSVANCYNDVVMLDTKTLEWSTPQITGTPPTPRAGHAAALLSDALYIVGGGNNSAGCADLMCLDLGGLATGQPLSWSSVAKAEPRSAIASEGLSLVPVRSAGALVAFGGYNGKYHNSAQVFRPGVVAPKPADEAEPLQAGSQKSKQKQEAGAILSHLKAEANGDVGRPEQRQDSGHVTPSKASTKASSQQSASAAEAAKEELASVRREAAAAKEASAAELSLMRRQLASAQSAAADAEAALAEAEKKLRAAAKEVDEQQSQIFRLEVRLAEANKKLEHTADLEKELLHYRKLAKDAEKKGQGGLWGYISGS